jgi:hypothetical protein
MCRTTHISTSWSKVDHARSHVANTKTSSANIRQWSIRAYMRLRIFTGKSAVSRRPRYVGPSLRNFIFSSSTKRHTKILSRCIFRSRHTRNEPRPFFARVDFYRLRDYAYCSSFSSLASLIEINATKNGDRLSPLFLGA